MWVRALQLPDHSNLSEGSEDIFRDRTDDIIATRGRKLRGEIDPIVLGSSLELAFDQHLGLAHPNPAAFDLKPAFVGVPNPLPSDVDVDVLDGLGRDALGSQRELAQAQAALDAHLVRRARRKLEPGAQGADPGDGERGLRCGRWNERKRV